MPNIQVEYDESDLNSFSRYYESVGRKLARAEIAPILKDAIGPIVAKEKDILSSHIVSGALSASISARTGPGDKLGVVSAFAAPTATAKQLKATWGRSTKQKRRFVQNIMSAKKRGRSKVFYADFVHHGHNIVKKGKVVRKAKPVPFAEQAVEQAGDQQAEIAAKNVLDKIFEV